MIEYFCRMFDMLKAPGVALLALLLAAWCVRELTLFLRRVGMRGVETHSVIPVTQTQHSVASSLCHSVEHQPLTPSCCHTVTFRLPETAGKCYALLMLLSFTSLAPFAGIAFLIGFGLYCLCQAVRGGSWRASLRRLGLTCMIALSALAFRGARLAGEKVGDSVRADYPFRIRGKNPLDAVARAYIDAHVDEEFRPYAWMIARHESRAGTRFYNQFNAPDDWMKELPNWGSPHGWGIAQIDKGRNGDSTAEVYDWHENVMSMNQVLCDKRERYYEILALYRAAYQNKPDAQWSEPDNVTTNIDGVTVSARQWAIMTLYNGAGGTHALLDNENYHTPIHFNAESHRWELYTNSNDYISNVIANRNSEARE